MSTGDRRLCEQGDRAVGPPAASEAREAARGELTAEGSYMLVRKLRNAYRDCSHRLPRTQGDAREAAMEMSAGGSDPWVVESFETDNPYLQKLFAHEMFGNVPNGCGELLGRVSTHVPDEQLVSAMKVRHGITEGGILMVTTHWLRYVKQGRVLTVISNDEFWPLDNSLELEANLGGRPIFRTIDGHQFQVFPTIPMVSRRQAKSFHEIYKLTALAGAYFVGEEQETAAGAQPVSGSASTVAEIRELAALRDAGDLTQAEFEAAKARLLGS